MSNTDTVQDVIIVGAGTAGLSAAIYTQRAGKHALVLEGSVYGGQIINTPDIENYPGIKHISGFDFANGLYEQAIGLGAEVKFEAVTGVAQEGSFFHVKTTSSAYTGKAVILAPGVTRRKLGISGEDELAGKGVSYCATCDGAFYKGKDVAVNGGGNTALEDAQFLSGLCRKVYLIHRRDAFRADASEVSKIRAKENVVPVMNSTIDALQAGADGKLAAVETIDKTNGEKQNIPVSGLFIAIGQVPANGKFAELVDLDDDGYIVAGEDCRTSRPGVFAAGDCRTKKVRQLTTAAADGAVAALNACSYIEEHG